MSAQSSRAFHRWSDSQFVLDADGLPLPRGTRALEDPAEQADRKRARAISLGVPELPRDDRAAFSSSGDTQPRGGPAAYRRWLDSREKVDWVAVGERLGGTQCEQCLKFGHASCELHCITADAPMRWWHGPGADQGLVTITAAAREREEAEQRGAGGAWRREWPKLRQEELYLQGQGYLVNEERVVCGRPDSIEWMVEFYATQIACLKREGWEDAKAEAYTLLACCATKSLSRDHLCDHKDYPASARLVREVLLARADASPDPAPDSYASLAGVLSLSAADPAWDKIRDARSGKPAPLGQTFITSALAMASANPDENGGRIYHVQIARGGVVEWLPIDSDVICFKSSAPDGDTFRSLVGVGGYGYHLPPGARITLEDVQDKFKAYGKQVRRRLFTVRVAFATTAFSASGEPGEPPAAAAPAPVAMPAADLVPSAEQPPAADAEAADGACCDTGSGYNESGDEGMPPACAASEASRLEATRPPRLVCDATTSDGASAECMPPSGAPAPSPTC